MRKLKRRTIHWSEVETVDDRPVAYVAAGSHGVWPTPGAHIYTNVCSLIDTFEIDENETDSRYSTPSSLSI